MRKNLKGKIAITSLAIIVILGGAIYVRNSKNHTNNTNVGITQAESNGKTEDENVGDKNNLNTNVTDNSDETGNLDENTNLDVPMVALPDQITGMKSETAVNAELRDLIIDYYEIPEEYYGETKYYYNYVDLDNDGTNEIFAVVMGSYTSGTGGSSALWLTENAGKWHIKQDFTLINPPVIISDTMTNGVHDLVVPYYGGGAEGNYAILKYKDGEYTWVSDSETVKDIDNITGTAILANDIPAERDAGIEAHTLLDE